MTQLSIEKVEIELTTDFTLPAYDNTRLVAVNTCPTWGIVRYGMHKSMHLPAAQGGSRQMALECGSAAHDFFAAVRLWQLRTYQGHTSLADFHGKRLFGVPRYQQMLGSIGPNEDPRVQSLQYSLSALETTGYYDDPRDKRRTYTNLEEACIAYIDRWDWNRMPVWIRNVNDPQSDVGIELPFDVTLSFMLSDGSIHRYRFIGKADGLHQRDNELYLHENKTASRLDEAWSQSFLLSSQITGYCLALGVWAGEAISKAEIFGMSIPLPKNYDFGGIVREVVPRYTHHFERWFDWFLHTIRLEQQYKDDPIHAPKYTHSCNRYFRPCSLIPFCDATDDEQELILTEMYEDQWNPLHEVQGGD